LQNTKENCVGPAIQNKSYGMLISGVALLHDNVHPHTAAHTRALLENFNWELFDHPSYSPDVALSDCHLFAYQKNWLGSQCFNNNGELMNGVKTWMCLQVADFFDTGIQKLTPRYDKCLNSNSNYAEK
jgi:histone-lysine N-methyltransferase SETMAR